MYLANNKEELKNYLSAFGWTGEEEVWQFEDGTYFLAAQEGDMPFPLHGAVPIGKLREVVAGNQPEGA